MMLKKYMAAEVRIIFLPKIQSKVLYFING
jgi:hypothetical protein